MSEVPTPVSESTAIEVVRKEGSAASWTAIAPILAGQLLYQPNASGVLQTVAGLPPTTIVGVALFPQTSGGRVTTIKGKVRVLWDGAGSPVYGTPIGPSAIASGFFNVSAATSGTYVLGTVAEKPGFAATSANSGLGIVVELY